MKEAAAKTLDAIPKEQKKDYISKTDWNMMTLRETAIENGQYWEAEQLNKQIKQQIKQDKLQAKINTITAFIIEKILRIIF